MGYKYIQHSMNDIANFAANWRASEIFVYFGHGDPGILLGDNTTWSYTSANISSWNNNSLSNNKISIIYACYGADTPTGGTSILDAVHGRGSQCSVAWHDPVYIPAAEEWNRLFWEKVCNENETVVEGYRHADYWLNDIYGTTYYINMNTNREERGNIYINL